MTPEDEGRRILDEKLKAYVADRYTFVRGFVRFVIRQGHGALCSIEDPKTRTPITWQARGRQLYGAELFNDAMREELVRMKEQGETVGA